MSRRQDAALQTRQLIIETARRQFAAQGYDKPTIAGIAKEAGVAVGTVMLHGGDKRGLLALCLEEQITQALREMEIMPLLPGVSAARRLARLTEPLFRRYFQSPALSRVLVEGSLFVQSEAKQGQQRQIMHLRQLAMRHGGLPENDPRLALFMAAYLFTLVGALRQETPSLPETIATLEALLTGIQGLS